jgi:hypothetical protein
MTIRLPIRGIERIECAFEELVVVTGGRRIDLLASPARKRAWGYLVPMFRLSANSHSVALRFVWTGIFQTIDLVTRASSRTTAPCSLSRSQADRSRGTSGATSRD